MLAGADLERISDILAEVKAFARVNPGPNSLLKVRIADFAVTVIVKLLKQPLESCLINCYAPVIEIVPELRLLDTSTFVFTQIME